MGNTQQPPQPQSTGTTVYDSPQFEHKRIIIASIVMGLWVALGVLGIIYAAPFYDLSVYFLSLTGFVGSYIISETKRPASSSGIFKKGRSSKREIITYVVVGLWLALGSFGIVTGIELLEAAAYFSALTPYVSTYLLGSAYKPDVAKSQREHDIEDDDPYFYGRGGHNRHPNQNLNNPEYNGHPDDDNQLVDVVSRPDITDH